MATRSSASSASPRESRNAEGEPASACRGSSYAALLAPLAFTYVAHAAVVGLSALGARPLSGRSAALAILVFAFVAAATLVRGVAPAPAPRSEALPSTAKLALAFLRTAASLALGFGIAVAIVLPVVAYDALAYRLPAIAQWLNAGRIAWVATDDPVRNGYPLGQEALSALIAAATGTLRFASATSFLYVACGASAIGWLAEESGVRRELARASAALFLLVPMVILNAPSGYVDAAFAAATITLLCCAALYARARSPDARIAATTGMAAANVLALKGTGIVFAGLCGGALFALALFRSRARSAFVALAIAAICALPGAFWILRNVAHTGNPLWPMTINIGQRTLFHGVGSVESILDTAHNTPRELAVLPSPLRVVFTWLELHGPATDFDDRLAGLGLAWPLFALPALAGLAASLLRRREPEPEQLVLGLFIVLTLGCFLLQPMRWWPRYTLFVWGAGAIAIAFQAERWAARAQTRALAIYLSAVALLCVSEAALCLPHAKEVKRAYERLAGTGASFAAWTDIRHAPNARTWIAPKFWELGLEHRRCVCRGFWKPETDNPNLDGVLAQLDPYQPVYAIDDDRPDWPRVRARFRALGCSELLLFPRSPVLRSADGDPEVSVEPAVAFDAFFIVRPRTALARVKAEQAPP